MELKCNIKGKEYDLVQGATITEEYNETLDSANIIVDQIEKIDDLQPYDDVYIYDGEFKGYSNSTEVIKSFYYETSPNENKIIFNKKEMKSLFIDTSKLLSQDISLFYSSTGKSLTLSTKVTFEYKSGNLYINFTSLTALGSQKLKEDENYYYFDYTDIFAISAIGYAYLTYENEEIELPKFYKHFLVYQYSEERLNPIGNSYKYIIELCSETKRLETIQLPNISITQPLEFSLKRSVYDYIKQYLDLYNLQVKVATSDNTWIYENKYTLDDSLKDIYSNVFSPDFSLDNPSLRDVFAQLFLVKDRIPYVKDDKIYALDITARTGLFDTKNITSIKGSRSYENHANNLKRTYSNAISGKNTAKRLEYLGFRNSDNALMTIGNMRLETQFPIYKINKIYMCYYKKISVYKDNAFLKTKGFLCKQDITPLVKLEQERQVLSQDWNDFNDNPPTGDNCIEEMAKYKLCTLGYSIGGNTISGWGTQYTYPEGWWDITATYIENIFKIIDANIPYGVYTSGYITENLGEGEYVFTQGSSNPLDDLITPFEGSSRLKSFFFIVDYEAFYNGTILTSKDVERDDIVINDNSSSSLTLLEKDGLFQKEKANRFGNMAYTIEAIYDSIDDVQELGSVYDDDVIIYHREISIFSKYVKALYYGTKDYVLKNYYTSVYSKHRPFALMSYSESVKRAENKKTYILLSKNKLYYEDRFEKKQDAPFNFSNFSSNSILTDIISFANPTLRPTSIDRFDFDKKINYGYIVYNSVDYACDVNTFVNGYSLCFNLSMTDNISAGNYIKEASPDINTTILTPTDDDYTGSVQDFYSIVDNSQTGFAETMGFYVSHMSQSSDFNDIVFDYSSGVENTLYKKIFDLPKLNNVSGKKYQIGKSYNICKDNKEVIDMTFQIEAYTNDEDVLFSEWLLKLSDLNGIYKKNEENYIVYDTEAKQYSASIYYGSAYKSLSYSPYFIYLPAVILKMSIENYDKLYVGQKLNSIHVWNISKWQGGFEQWFQDAIVGYAIDMQSIASIDNEKIGINCNVKITTRHGLWGGETTEAKTTIVYLYKFTKLGVLDFSSDTENYYFSNLYYVNSELRTRTGVEIGYFGDDNSYNEMKSLDDGKMSKNNLLMASKSGSHKFYWKNMFIKTSTEKMKKTLVYDEYAFRQSDYEYSKITDAIYPVVETSSEALTHDYINKIRINIREFDDWNIKSIQFWYREDLETQPYFVHFVFGVNVTEEDFKRGYVDIYLSSLSRKDTRVFGTDHLEIGKVMNYSSTNNKKRYGERQYYVVE